MKEFIRELLKETLSNKNVIAYHGSQHEIAQFTDEFVGGKNATDQEGPGIYFTTSLEEATKYAANGGFVYKVELTPKILLTTKSKPDLSYLSNKVNKLIQLAPNWKRIAKGYDDDMDEALYEMVSKYIGMSRSEKEVFVTLYEEIYKNSATNYVRNMVKLGFDGIYLPSRDGGAHVVIYNPKNIKVLGKEQIK